MIALKNFNPYNAKDQLRTYFALFHLPDRLGKFTTFLDILM